MLALVLTSVPAIKVGPNGYHVPTFSSERGSEVPMRQPRYAQQPGPRQMGQFGPPSGPGPSSAASLQFMITQKMRMELAALGYSAAEIDRMDPPHAAQIIESSGGMGNKRPRASMFERASQASRSETSVNPAVRPGGRASRRARTPVNPAAVGAQPIVPPPGAVPVDARGVVPPEARGPPYAQGYGTPVAQYAQMYDDAIQQLEAENNALRVRCDAAEAMAQALRGQVDALNAENDALRNRAEAAEAMAEALRNESKALRERTESEGRSL